LTPRGGSGEASRVPGDPTHATYSDPEVVRHYDHSELQPAERYLFERYVPDGARVLDLGVGAGRTTPHLAARAARYVGLDYAEAMVERARARFPDREFTHGDATDLSRYGDAEFSVVVFSFNGLGCLPTDELRARCLREMARVLEPGGALVLSLHNASCLLFWPDFRGASAPKRVWRAAYAGVASARVLRSRLPSLAAWRGAAYVPEVNAGGQKGSQTIVWAASPPRVRRELDQAGLTLVERVAPTHPSSPPGVGVPWWYYAAIKPRDARR